MSDQAYPLAWPAGWARTPVGEAAYGGRFRQRRQDGSGTTWVTFGKARDKLYAALESLGAENVVLSTNHKPDVRGVPIESKRPPADDGVAVYFQYLGKSMVMACDRFDTAAANMRSLGLAIEAMRQLERHGGGTMMQRAFEGFIAIEAPGAKHWTSVLGVKPTATRMEIEAAFRRLARERHPDQGGDDNMMAELNAARSRALSECRRP